jgi:catechol 2,3-dioxygenase-like lactoylglutathione lyase family enzyme
MAMAKATVDGVRSVALGVPDLDASAKFYAETWHLDRVAATDNAVYFRGTGAYHHILSLHRRPRPELLSLDLTAPDRASVEAIHKGLGGGGAREIGAPATITEPGGGYGFAFRDPEGRAIRVIAGDTRHGAVKPAADRPSKITHVVLNSRDRAAATKFFCDALGFKLIDETRALTFLNCNEDHHSIALADGDSASLHHIAFEMIDIDSVMRGAGRMREAGFAIEWGVGRHGPGDNVFAYFVGPNDEVIEYTAEVEQVDASYKVRGPAEWTWPPGRLDHWGIAIGPTDRLKAAQKKLRFAQSAPV